MIILDFYKNSELAKDFGISKMTVARYIENSKNGHNDLELIFSKGHFKIKKTELNKIKIKSLIADKKKFKNPKRYKVIEVRQEFFLNYSNRSVLEIYKDLKNNSYINTKFCYLGTNSLTYLEYLKSRKNNKIKIDLLYKNIAFLEDYARENQIKYNIIELGPSDMTSTEGFVKSLNENNLVNNYLALDFSKELLNINQRRFRTVFDNIEYNNKLVDIEQEEIYEIITDNKYKTTKSTNVVNLFLLIGCTACNFFKPCDVYSNLYNSLNKDDFLVLDFIKQYPEMKKNKIYDQDSLLYKYLSFLLKNIGLRQGDFVLNSYYDEAKNTRLVFATIQDNINLRFGDDYEDILIKKNQEILLLINRVDNNFDMEAMKNNNFNLINLNTSISMDYINCLYRRK